MFFHVGGLFGDHYEGEYDLEGGEDGLEAHDLADVLVSLVDATTVEEAADSVYFVVLVQFEVGCFFHWAFKCEMGLALVKYDLRSQNQFIRDGPA